MYLSYSGYKKYKDCPRCYWHDYIQHTSVQPENCVGSLYGSTIGTVFEIFYVQKMWRHSNPTEALSTIVKDVAKGIIQKEVKKGRTVNWKDRRMRNIPRSFEALVADVRLAIPNGLRIIVKNRLLGPHAQAEVNLDSVIGRHTVGGRCDFIIDRIEPMKDLVIVDGKGSVHRDKYVDVVQLQMYAMLHRKKFGRLPDQIGFLFWRSTPDEAMDWFSPDPSEIDDLEKRVLDTMGVIEKKTHLPMLQDAFPAKPQTGKCKLCRYLSVCPEGSAMTSENPPPVPMGIGVEDVSLD